MSGKGERNRLESFDPYEQWLGIPPSLRPIDYYTLLGIEKFCDDRQKIAEAAEKRMRLLRRYQTGPRGVYTQPLLNEIAQAKLRLLDPKRKAEYDERLRQSAQWAAELASQDDSLRLPPEFQAAFTSGVWYPHPSGSAPVASTVPPGAPPAFPVNPNMAVSPPRGAVPCVPPQVMPSPSAATPGGQPPVVVTPPVRLARPPKRRTHWLDYLWVGSLFLLTLLLAAVLVIALRSGWFDRRHPEISPSSDHVVTPDIPTTVSDDGKTVVLPNAQGIIRLVPEMANRDSKSGEKGGRGQQPVEWLFAVVGTNTYRLQLVYTVQGEIQGAQWQIELDGQSKTLDLLPAEGNESAKVETMITVRGAGQHRLALRLANSRQDLVVQLHEVVLVPIRARKAAL
ncbi:MAG: hypothetical protein KatS3mg110_1445 [Pirellulaceae bacterium]|nr:MAG: hypothetical protein KatS3mg110_1445 [Pirellulaceae bacterium]